MTTLPTWAVYAVSFGTPVVTLAGVLLAQLFGRKGARELEARSRREETMRNLRWVAELAVNGHDRMADLGVAQLAALLDSDLLDESEKIFVEAALDVVYEDPEAELDELGEDAEVVQYLPSRDKSEELARSPDEDGAVGSTSDRDGEGEDDE